MTFDCQDISSQLSKTQSSLTVHGDSLRSTAVLVGCANKPRWAKGGAKVGEGSELRGDWGGSFFIYLAASPLSSAPDKTAMLRRLLW